MRKKILVPFCSMLFFSACVSNADEVGKTKANSKSELQQQQVSAKRNQVYAELNALSDINSCTQESDCAAMPLGSRACGGPASYIAYAKNISADKLAELTRLAEQSKLMDTKLNELSGFMSTCVYLAPPALICEDKLCKTSTAVNVR